MLCESTHKDSNLNEKEKMSKQRKTITHKRHKDLRLVRPMTMMMVKTNLESFTIPSNSPLVQWRKIQSYIQ